MKVLISGTVHWLKSVEVARFLGLDLQFSASASHSLIDATDEHV